MKSAGKSEDWDLRVESLVKLIEQVKNPYTKQSINERYVKTLYLSKKIPNNRALSYKVLNTSINTFVEQVVEQDIKARAALDLVQVEFW